MVKEHSAICVRLFTYESDLPRSQGHATIAVELHSKFEYVYSVYMYTQCSTSHTVMMHRNMGKEHG